MEGARRTTLITGAASGIGRRTAHRLAARGDRIGIGDRAESVHQLAEELRTAGADAASEVFDIADPEAVEEGVRRLQARVGPADILVANAAIVDQLGSARRFRIDAWRREIDVNLSGAYWCVRAVLSSMCDGGWGRIVIVSSNAATNGLPGQVAYSASKSGLLGLMRTVAIEAGPSGVTCNAILPGMIATEKGAGLPDHTRAAYVERIPIGRFGEMDEVAALIEFLTSPEAGYVTGAAIPIDGGFGLNMLSLSTRG